MERHSPSRRRFLAGSAAAAFLPRPHARANASARTAAAPSPAALARMRPGAPGWPSAAEWERLGQAVGGRLARVRSPLLCADAAPGEVCPEVFSELKNPYYIGDDAGLAQTLGWVDAWTFRPSVWAVAAETAAEVAAAVNFARNHNLRLVVKGGGHSYLGRSNAADSLLIWTRHMNRIVGHDDFVAAGCGGREASQPAVSVGAGVVWGYAYNDVTTTGGRYVQGGGCLTVGVAGLVQAGGFGSFSKQFGTAAANLLEAEIVTADGRVRIANHCTHPDLFWGIKGGGGGSLGVVTRLTLRTHDMPAFVGGVRAVIDAASDDAFRRLVSRFIAFYADNLLNPHWGESVTLRPGNRMDIRMAFQGLTRQEAEAVWRPFFAWVAASHPDFVPQSAPVILAIPGRSLWDPAFLRAHLPALIRADDRPGAPADNVFWAGNLAEAGHVIYGYASVWLPRPLLDAGRQGRLADAFFTASRRRPLELHFNKGLAGGSAMALTATRETAMNPKVLDAFALAIIGGEGPPAYPGIPGHEPDLAAARREAGETAAAIAVLRALAPEGGAYFAESDFFEPGWQQSYWGPNYPRLAAVKRKYDPEGLFVVHHGVGSEAWSADGFTRSHAG